jgi:hypothetical protein
LLERLKGHFEADSGLKMVNVIYAWHGCSHQAADSICSLGGADLRKTDGGYFGSLALEFMSHHMLSMPLDIAAGSILVAVNQTLPANMLRCSAWSQSATLTRYRELLTTRTRMTTRWGQLVCTISMWSMGNARTRRSRPGLMHISYRYPQRTNSRQWSRAPSMTTI